MSPARMIQIAAVLGGLSVALGAFGAHGLTRNLADTDLSQPDQARLLENWEVASRYQMYHALALLGIGLIAEREAKKSLAGASYCFLTGTCIFSGSLYALVLTRVKAFGAIVPVGGSLLIVGWVLLAIAASRRQARS